MDNVILLPITKESVNKYSRVCRKLYNLKTTPEYKGFIVKSQVNGSFMGYIQVNDNLRMLSDIQVFNEFRKQGIGNYLLEIAINKLGITNLRCKKNATVAFEMFKKHGFEVEEETGLFYYMNKSR